MSRFAWRLACAGTAAWVVISLLAMPNAAEEAAPPKAGEKAPAFSLESLRGKPVELAKLVEQGPVVLVVLRGYPGYQCPICSRQVGELLPNAAEFKKAGARVVLVYPGPNDDLKLRAEEFVGDRTLPEHFEMALDPDYKFTNAYRLRWDAPRETAYPSTFVIDKAGVVRFAHISHSHGDRVAAKAMLEALASAAK